jgi:hypothetical protein
MDKDMYKGLDIDTVQMQPWIYTTYVEEKLLVLDIKLLRY